MLGDGFEEVDPPVASLGLEILGDLDLVPRRALRLVVPDDGLEADEVDHAAEHVAFANRDLDRDGVCAEPVLHHLHGGGEVRARTVHLVDEGDARDVVLVHLPPDRLGLRLDAADRAEERDRAVEHAERALDLDREVDVAGRVDDVDPVVVQKQVVAADVIVMPRSFSCSIQSIVAPPSWTSPMRWSRPV